MYDTKNYQSGTAYAIGVMAEVPTTSDESYRDLVNSKQISNTRLSVTGGRYIQVNFGHLFRHLEKRLEDLRAETNVDD